MNEYTGEPLADINSTRMHLSSFFIPPYKTQQRRELIFPHMISDWNLLPHAIINSCFVEAFKVAGSCIKILISATFY